MLVRGLGLARGNLQRRLIGRITVADVMDVIRDKSDSTMMQMAGLDDEADMFAPVLVSSRRCDACLTGRQAVILTVGLSTGGRPDQTRVPRG